MDETAPRSGKDLLLATRPFAQESPRKSWWLLGTTLAALVAASTAAVLIPWWPLRAVASVLSALLMVRGFTFFHDHQHGAILRNSKLAEGVLGFFGLLMLAPPRSWKASHNYHHANVAKVDAPAIGSYPVKSVRTWRTATTWERLQYRITRHPLTILLAGFTVFGLNITLLPLLQNPRRHWDSALSLLVHGGVVTALWWTLGPAAALLGFMLPYLAAAALGAYLFYAQHNFPGVHMLPREQWSYYRAALESSSYLRTGQVLRWFTGNIGFHHVHHLNPAIPLYRLEETMAALPELQRPCVTTLKPGAVVACFRANVWDEERQSMVTWREASGRPRSAHKPRWRARPVG